VCASHATTVVGQAEDHLNWPELAASPQAVVAAEGDKVEDWLKNWFPMRTIAVGTHTVGSR
jgi:hypothetical protein